MGDLILVIDEGTTSTRAIVYDRDFREVALAQEEVSLQYPADGWVEQDGEEIWRRTVSVCRAVISQAGGAERFAGIGITNQRETTLVWDRASGRPIAPAIVWQDRRTADVCASLRGRGQEASIQERTGLLLDPYFSATKAAWILDKVPGAREGQRLSELAFGTVDSFLLWRLTEGRVHATDATNASRTLLYPLGFSAGGSWSRELADVFRVPESLLPEVRPSAAAYGETAPDLFGRALPVCAILGDQQAALVGQGCLKAGQAKITYGTGAFLVTNTGDTRPHSENRLLATIGYDLGTERAFALEGSIFNAGTVIKWLRDDLRLIQSAAESERAAASLPDNGGVYMVPAFTGLGAPHWNAEARGQITGLTRAATAAHLVRAGLESVAYQTHDLLAAFAGDGAPIAELRVDGGMVANDWLMQFLADICALPVFRPDYREMTALGAAAAAAMQLGWITPGEWGERAVPGRRFEPKLDAAKRGALLAGWQAALQRTLLP